jgi:hypothetical protein
MAKGKIYLIDESTNKMVALEESGYLLEVNLQEILAEHPDLLAGDQINPDDPRRWLLVSREMGIPGNEYETGRWSLDHLFIDQDGIPTFVECKRSTDTRARREVVAQMLDYAANGIEYWDVNWIRQVATETAEDSGKSLDNEVIELLKGGAETDIEGFWGKVEENLKHHKVRLIFVTDHTPRELRRLVEFLNDEMINIEVLAIEVKQYKSTLNSSEKALVPRVLGMTEAARSIKQKTTRNTNRTDFLSRCTPEARDFFERVLDLATEHKHVIYWGTAGFSVRGRLGEDGTLATFVYGYPPNKFQFYFHPVGQIPRDKDSVFRKELLDSGQFDETGEYTLTSLVETGNVESLLKLYKFILQRIHEFEIEFNPD